MIDVQRTSDSEVSIEKEGVKIVVNYDEALIAMASWWEMLREDVNVALKIQEYRRKYAEKTKTLDKFRA